MSEYFKTLEGSPVITGIPQVHHTSFLSNFQNSYGKKEDGLYATLEELTKTFLEMDLKKLPRYVFLCGTPGSGKTHYMVGLYRAMAYKLGYVHGDGIFFTTYVTMAQEVIAGFKENIPTRTALQGYTQAQFLFIDDFTSTERVLKEGSFEANMLLDILIDRYERNQCLITSSNLSAEDLMIEMNRLFGAYVTSRLSDSKIISFPSIDFRRK